VREGSTRIDSTPHPRCDVCGAAGEWSYRDLTDRLRGAPETWSLMRCTDAACGALWLNPMPSPETLHHAYAAYYTHDDRREPTWLQRVYRAALDRTRAAALRYPRIERAGGVEELLAATWSTLDPGLRAEALFGAAYTALSGGRRVLDVGCGAGDFLVRMRALGWSAHGLEVDEHAVAQARLRGVEVTCATLEAFERPGAYDLVTLRHVIEHVHDPVGDLRRCRELLAPGGRLVVVTPNIDGVQHRRFGPHWFGLDPPRHLHLFTPRALTLASNKAGFTSVRAFTTVREADRVWIASRDIRARGVHEWGRTGGAARLLAARVVQAYLWLRLIVDAGQGDELVITAERN